MLRAGAAVICALMALYWFGVGTGTASLPGGGSFRVLMAMLAGGWIVLGIMSLLASPATQRSLLRPLAGGFGLYAALFPVLLYIWTRSDTERLIWVIRQLYPCSTMGGGPGSLFVGASSWILAIAALSFALIGAFERRVVLRSAFVGAGLVGATMAAMFPDPRVFAWILGCL